MLSWSILQYFWPALNDNLVLKANLVFFWSGRLRQVLLYIMQWLMYTSKHPQMKKTTILKAHAELQTGQLAI